MKNIAVIAPTLNDWKSFENTDQCDELYERIKVFLKESSKKEGVCLISSLNIGFETLTATAVLTLKDECNLMLQCVIPYEERANDWSEPDRDRYFSVIEKCDKETIIERKYSTDSEYNCMCYMVDSADEIITFGELTLKSGIVLSNSGKKTIKFD